MSNGERIVGRSENLAPSKLRVAIEKSIPLNEETERKDAIARINVLLARRSLNEVQNVLNFVETQTIATGDVEE